MSKTEAKQPKAEAGRDKGRQPIIPDEMAESVLKLFGGLMESEAAVREAKGELEQLRKIEKEAQGQLLACLREARDGAGPLFPKKR